MINLWTKAQNVDLLCPTTLKRKIGYHDSEDEDMPEIGRMKVNDKIV